MKREVNQVSRTTIDICMNTLLSQESRPVLFNFKSIVPPRWLDLGFLTEFIDQLAMLMIEFPILRKMPIRILGLPR
jgi:hypothetical protein